MKKISKVKKKLPKLYFTIQDALVHGACEEGVDTFLKYLEKKKIKHTNKTKFNLLILLKSNSVADFFWMLIYNLNSKISLKISLTISKNAAARAITYTAAAAYAIYASRAMDTAAATAKAAARAEIAANYAPDNIIRRAAVCAIMSSSAATSAASTAAWAADTAANSTVASAAERKLQIKDIKKIIGE